MTVNRPARALGLLAATLALAAGPVACGSDSGGGGDKSDVEATVHKLYNGFADKKPDAICDTLTKKQKDTLTKRPGPSGKKQSCEDVMRLVLGLAGDQL